MKIKIEGFDVKRMTKKNINSTWILGLKKKSTRKNEPNERNERSSHINSTCKISESLAHLGNLAHSEDKNLKGGFENG